MPEQNGVPRWVDERFKAIDQWHAEMTERMNGIDGPEGRIEKLAQKQQQLRDMMFKMQGMAAGIGAMVGILMVLLSKLLGVTK